MRAGAGGFRSLSRHPGIEPERAGGACSQATPDDDYDDDHGTADDDHDYGTAADHDDDHGTADHDHGTADHDHDDDNDDDNDDGAAVFGVVYDCSSGIHVV